MKDLVAYGIAGMVLDSSTDTVIYERFIQRGGHKGILCYHGTFDSGILLEHASHGNIRSYLDNHPPMRRERYSGSYKVAEALDFVLQCGVIHGDVNGFNVLLEGALMRNLRISPGLSDGMIIDHYAKGKFSETESPGVVGSIITKCWREEYAECKPVVHE
ncbi:hypothetical protein N657DRAFT_664296 [Parathielavia appendiculata]|uniref:Serine-threonine/tyrosine-protein kinase catalytic domain-containing protein n=1 Tax=Parathielavia appendiculata TaxID=2587402 RepID=A0AAN6Z401_9PEZI|nr:hypothetical protein N657DRAFT_664296 [Parathielavia appendiculata]